MENEMGLALSLPAERKCGAEIEVSHGIVRCIGERGHDLAHSGRYLGGLMSWHNAQGFPRLEASCSHGPGAYLTGTRICSECLPADRAPPCPGCGEFGRVWQDGVNCFCQRCNHAFTGPVRGLPRPLGEQLVEGFTRILGTPREPEDQARQLAQFILLEFDIMRRVIT
jgi:hypothetical protein